MPELCMYNARIISDTHAAWSVLLVPQRAALLRENTARVHEGRKVSLVAIKKKKKKSTSEKPQGGGGKRAW